MADFTRVDWQALDGARKKLRQLTKQLEEGKRPANDMVHPAYKLGQFLTEAFPDAWPLAEAKAPDYPPPTTTQD